MKKLIALFAFIVTGTFVAVAQTPAASTATTTTEQSATDVTPVVNAVDMNQPVIKCDATAKTKSCCSHGSKTAAVTATTSTETTSTATTTSEAPVEQKCESVGFGMSAAKPEVVIATDGQPKE